MADRDPLAPSLNERIAALDRLQNVVAHADWRELYLKFTEDAAIYRQAMEDAPNWDSFVQARALYQHTRDYLLRLPEIVRYEKEELEAELLSYGQPLPPTDYERE